MNTHPLPGGLTPPRPRRHWGRWLLLLVLLGVLAAYAAAWATVLSEGPDALIHVVVNGEQIDVRSDGPLPPAHAVALAGSVVLVALLAVGIALMVVPLALLAVGLALGLVLLTVLGLPLLALGGVTALLLAPLAWLVLRLWRGPRRARSIGA